ncbi:MAG: hypothetical protein AAF657_09240 [Acidobacteriota bacterium]
MMNRLAIARLPGGLSAPTAWLGALGLSCLSLACARTSEERVAAIGRLLEEARTFDAEDYAPQAFAKAEGLLAEARAELEVQRSKPWFRSSPRRSRELLEESEAAASLARAEAAAGVVRARREASQAVIAAHSALDRASEAYWRSPRGKDARVDLLRMRSDLDALLGDLTEAELALEHGDFLQAGRLAAAVRQRADTVGRTIHRATASRIPAPTSRIRVPASSVEAMAAPIDKTPNAALSRQRAS